MCYRVTLSQHHIPCGHIVPAGDRIIDCEQPNCRYSSVHAQDTDHNCSERRCKVSMAPTERMRPAEIPHWCLACYQTMNTNIEPDPY